MLDRLHRLWLSHLGDSGSAFNVQISDQKLPNVTGLAPLAPLEHKDPLRNLLLSLLLLSPLQLTLEAAAPWPWTDPSAAAHHRRLRPPGADQAGAKGPPHLPLLPRPNNRTGEPGIEASVSSSSPPSAAPPPRFRRRQPSSATAEHPYALRLSSRFSETSPLSLSPSGSPDPCRPRPRRRRSSSPAPFPATIGSVPPPPSSPRRVDPSCALR